MRRFREDETTEMAALLKEGGCLSVPTDTVFGICAAMNEASMEKLYEVKNRPRSRQFPIVCSDLSMLEDIAVVSREARRVIQAFMPGPLTVVLRKTAKIPDYAAGETIAVRLAMSEALRRLVEETGSPLFLTSANRSGEKECESLDEIEKACPKLDGMMEGSVSFGRASTILDCSDEEWRILREGPISREEIEKLSGGKRVL
ncbi:MAG: threonylcarbamoyl-AMP synthase [Solobacterium sp.]|nr:threonylcarbamoyl-AMP synthase [Solobacterium sp.]